MSLSRVASAVPVRPDPDTVLYGVGLVNLELLFVLLYPSGSAMALRGWLNVLYAFVWINVGLWAVWRTWPAPSWVDATGLSPSRRLLSACLAGGYVLVLGYVGGLWTLSGTGAGWGVATLIPGWGPALTYDGAGLSVVLFPYKTVGYLALGYLVYATVLDAARSVAAGLLGLVSCVSCTWPVLLTLVTGFVGSTSGVATAVYAQSYALSTAVFVLTVALLRYRPFR